MLGSTKLGMLHAAPPESSEGQALVSGASWSVAPSPVANVSRYHDKCWSLTSSVTIVVDCPAASEPRNSTTTAHIAKSRLALMLPQRMQ